MAHTTSSRNALPAGAMVGTLASFVIVLLLAGLLFRNGLHQQILQREAESLDAVTRMQLTDPRLHLSRVGAGSTADDVFSAGLESSRMKGVLAFQLYDAKGVLIEALPEPGTERILELDTKPAVPAARYLAAGVLADVVRGAKAGGPVPLLEVVLPMSHAANGGYWQGWLRYWIDGRAVQADLRRVDASLGKQVGAATLAGVVVIAALLSWSFRRMNRLNRELSLSREDLVRANRELAFAAKTAALGAVSAHLVHGLRNPIAGLGGFVEEASSGGGPEWLEAVATTRRLQSMVDEAVSLLRHEGFEGDTGTMKASEIAELVRKKHEAEARGKRLRLCVACPVDAEVPLRGAQFLILSLSNVTKNALQASHVDETVQIVVEVAGDEVHFDVIDTGPGLPDAVRQHLFQPTLSGRRDGSGIGMAISRELMRCAGGSIELSRTGPLGTAFRLKMPLSVNSVVNS